MYGIFPGRLLTVAPDPATGQDFGESGAVTTGGDIEHGAHRVGLDLVSAQPGGNPSGGKESERDQGHQPVMVVIAGGRGWDPLLIRAGHCSGLASFLGVMDPSATHARILLALEERIGKMLDAEEAAAIESLSDIAAALERHR